MAKQTNTALFLGTDFQYVLHVKNQLETLSVDITGWSLSWMVKRRVSDPDASAVLTKTTANGAIVIGGVFNPTPASNTQRATVTLVDTDTDALVFGVAHYEFKRMDDGFETVLAYGLIDLRRGVIRA